MKNILICFLIIFLVSCKKNKETKDIVDFSKNNIKNFIAKKNLKNFLKSIKDIEYAGNKYSDIRTNNNFLLDEIFDIDKKNISVQSISYTYKNDYVFYLHTVKHINDSISIKPYIENAQGKYTDGYLKLRVLIFTMKNDREANFIDIPLTSGYSKKYNELIKKVYNEIDFAVMTCDSTQACKIKNFEK
ncbi:hypothetical protein [uncultured Algibacter sp.]|uniref:hypothetical protein n=1 Tax=uncultured Algibacter sp. TaxID=298659 RepID=UPI0032174B11